MTTDQVVKQARMPRPTLREDGEQGRKEFSPGTLMGKAVCRIAKWQGLAQVMQETSNATDVDIDGGHRLADLCELLEQADRLQRVHRQTARKCMMILAACRLLQEGPEDRRDGEHGLRQMPELNVLNLADLHRQRVGQAVETHGVRATGSAEQVHGSHRSISHVIKRRFSASHSSLRSAAVASGYSHDSQMCMASRLDCS